MPESPIAALVLDNIPLACYVLDHNANFSYVNKMALDYFKMSSDHMLGKHIWHIFPEAVDTDYYHELNEAILNRNETAVEFVSVFTKSWVKLTITPISIGLTVTFTSIEKDKYNESLYKTLVENTPDVVTKWDSELKLSYGNTSFEQSLALPIDDLLGRSPEEIWPDIDSNLLSENALKVLETGLPETITVSFQGRQGKRSYNIKMAPERRVYGKTRSVIAIGRDITEIEQHQQLFNAQLRNKYKSLFDSINQGFCIIEMIWNDEGEAIDYRFIEVNPAFEKLTGITDTRKTIKQIHPDAEDYWFRAYGDVAKTKTSTHFEHPAVLINGWYEIEAFPITALGDDVIGVLFNDVSERKNAENILRKSEEKQSYLLKLTDAIRIIADPLDIQEAAAKVLGEHLGVDSAFYGDIVNIEGIEYLQIERIFQNGGIAKAIRPGLHPFFDLGKHVENIKDGNISVVAHIDNEDSFSAEEKANYKRLGCISWVTMPLVKNGRAVAIFAVLNAKAYHWTDQHLTYIQETAERTWSYVEQTKMSKALNHSQEQLAVALTASNMSTFHWLAKSGDVVVSPLSPTVFGLVETASAYSNGEGFLMIHPDDREAHRKTLEEASFANKEYHQIYRIIRPIDGEIAWIEERGKGVYHQHTEIFEIRGIHWDITSQKNSEDLVRQAEEHYLNKLEEDVMLRTKELQDSRDELEAIYNNSLMSMSVLTAVRNQEDQIVDFRITMTNKALEKGTGRNDLIGKLYAEEYPGIKKIGIFELMLKVMETGLPKTHEYFYPYEDFNRWYSCMFVKMGDGLLATNLDISERKIAEQLYMDNSAMIEGIANSAPDMLYAINLENFQQFYSNRRIEKLVEKTQTEIKKMGKQFFEQFIHPADRQHFYDNLEELKEGRNEKAVKELTYRLIDAKGEIHWIKTKSVVYISDDSGSSTHIVGISQDITQQRELEERNKQLTYERQELEKQQQVDIIKATLNAQEEERHRIAESLHNGLGQVLYGVKATLERLNLDNINVIDDNIQILSRSKELLGICIQESRKISHELMPSILEDFGLKASIRDVCNQLKGKTHFKCTFSGVDVPMEKYVQLAVYRIVQELSLNIMKHADAGLAHIDISVADGRIEIVAKDNGRGFDNAAIREKGIGLKTIASKVKLLNGKLAISSKPSETIVTIQLPL